MPLVLSDPQPSQRHFRVRMRYLTSALLGLGAMACAPAQLSRRPEQADRIPSAAIPPATESVPPAQILPAGQPVPPAQILPAGQPVPPAQILPAGPAVPPAHVL